eukprot:9385596-Pyramimonas_sp.AAC.1
MCPPPGPRPGPPLGAAGGDVHGGGGGGDAEPPEGGAGEPHRRRPPRGDLPFAVPGAVPRARPRPPPHTRLRGVRPGPAGGEPANRAREARVYSHDGPIRLITDVGSVGICSHDGPIRLITDVGSAGIFSRRTNRT